LLVASLVLSSVLLLTLSLLLLSLGCGDVM